MLPTSGYTTLSFLNIRDLNNADKDGHVNEVYIWEEEEE